MLCSHASMAQTQVGSDIDGEAAGDISGSSVSMPDAYTVAIGAQYNDGNGTESGHVRVYKWNGNTWTQKGGDIDGEAAGDYSGVSVSMPDSNTVAIGAILNEDNGERAGHVRVYMWSGNSWVQKGGDIDGEDSLNFSGSSVSMPDSNTVAIGAPWNNGNGIYAGHVRVYRWNGSAWIQRGGDLDGEAASDESGCFVSMPDINTLAIGAQRNDSNGIDAGHVRVYRWSGNSWVQKGIDIDGDSAGDYFGAVVSMPDSNTVAIGAPYNAVNGVYAGQVRIYRWNGSMWVPKGMAIYGDTAYSSSYFVSMPDSNTIALGVFTSNGLNASRVRIYRWSDTAWVQRGVDINREAAADWAAIVSMPDSNTVAIGALGNDGNGLNSGHVRVFSLCNGSVDTSVTLSANTLVSSDSTATYQWLNCDSAYAAVNGATNRNFTPLNTGNYSVVVSRSHCVDTSACYNVVISGLNKQKAKKGQFTVYPNPTDGAFIIETNESSKNTSFEIRDVKGKVILKGKLKDKQTTLDLSDYSSGVYLLRVGDQNVKVVRK